MIRNIWLVGPLAIPASFGIIGVVTFAVWLWALIDLLKSNRSSEEKLIWVLVILFTYVIGAILYLAIGKKMKTPPRSRRLYRSTDRRIGGVLGGVAEYLEVDPTVVRIVFVLLTLIAPPLMIFSYIIAWIIIPSPSKKGEEEAASVTQGAQSSASRAPSKNKKKGGGTKRSASPRSSKREGDGSTTRSSSSTKKRSTKKKKRSGQDSGTQK